MNGLLCSAQSGQTTGAERERERECVCEPLHHAHAHGLERELGPPTPDTFVLQERLESAADADAAADALLLLHASAAACLPAGAALAHLLQVYRFADRYQLPDLHLRSLCARIASEALASGVTRADLEAWAALPPTLRCRDGLAALEMDRRLVSALEAEAEAEDEAEASSTRRIVMSLFGDVPAMMRSEADVGLFFRMPLRAVLAWAAADELRVHSENCVACLIDGWSWVRLHDAAERDFSRLLACLRVDQLSPAFVEMLACAGRGFSQPLSEALAAAGAYRTHLAAAAARSHHHRVDPADFGLCCRSSSSGDPATAKRAARVVVEHDAEVLEWRVPAEALAAALDEEGAGSLLSDRAAYVNGVFFRIEMTFARRRVGGCGCEGVEIRLGLAVELHTPGDRRLRDPAFFPHSYVSARLRLVYPSPSGTEVARGAEVAFSDAFVGSGGGDDGRLPGRLAGRPVLECEGWSDLEPWLDAEAGMHVRASDMRFT